MGCDIILKKILTRYWNLPRFGFFILFFELPSNFVRLQKTVSGGCEHQISLKESYLQYVNQCHK